MTNTKVLVVEDEVQYADVVAFKFRNAGFDVVTARDGQEALDVAAADKPDLIISDYQMPVLDGMEFCRRLRAKPETAAIPFILLTAHGLDIEDVAVGEAGVSAVVGKPFSPRELLAKANELLNRPRQTVAQSEGT
jgi:two-component system alkaline phosphatase synthesis response regulator PhoP